MNNAAFGLWKQNSIRYESTNLGSDQPHDKIRIIRGKGCLQVLNHHCRVSFLKKKKALLKLSQKVSETPHNPSITTYMPRQGVEVIHIHKRLEETDIIWLIIVGTRNEVGGGSKPYCSPSSIDLLPEVRLPGLRSPMARSGGSSRLPRSKALLSFPLREGGSGGGLAGRRREEGWWSI